MRIRLTINHLPNQKLPINYQYLISSWIYKTLHETDAEFAQWLHEHGYTINGKKYKHFCFSMLQPQRFKIPPKEAVFELVESPTELTLSFTIDQAVKNMVKGLFQDNMVQLSSGDFQMLGMVNQVQIEKPPVFESTMQFKTTTPICVSVNKPNGKHADYLAPTDERYAEAFANNLVDKANAYLAEEKFKIGQVKFTLLSKKPKSKLWTIKDVDIKGYLFDFELTAPKELMEIGYYAGYGVQNSSIGMGMCEIKGNGK